MSVVILKPIAKNLSATCTIGRGTGKVKRVTTISIKFGPTVVAERTVGGEYDEESAIAEFAKSRKGWIIKDAQAMEHCRLLGLVK